MGGIKATDKHLLLLTLKIVIFDKFIKGSRLVGKIRNIRWYLGQDLGATTRVDIVDIKVEGKLGIWVELLKTNSITNIFQLRSIQISCVISSYVSLIRSKVRRLC